MKLKKIAEGNTAEVFSLEPGKVIKLYHVGYPADEAIKEAEKCEVAFKQGLPTPRVIDLTTMDGRQGIVFDECSGPTMEARLRDHPTDIDLMAKTFAQLHHQIHDCSGMGLPTTQERTGMKISHAQILDEKTRSALQAELSQQPGETHFCHGDFHPGNVLLTEKGPVLIDWVDATMGSPVADVARTLMLIRYSEIPAEPTEALAFNRMKDAFLDAYLAHYTSLRAFPEQAMDRWLPLISAARLSENATGPDQTKAILSLVETSIDRSLNG
ncbi:aminoglycoside phosphotransferase family protein [Reinekea blandensis]|uniref:Possible aminoglycoside phosphotransferase (Protein kinase related), diverged n=1 Tax=Reinekea blandensis MED297 TaxID=314283 RepID=A4BB27_9GAMM|nr:aminoglycoside phosphotransferase family protein [Reinekea blandensis]EAR10640.1 Possible aminoglycoside phosphotransferase (protein kinase related), diverged [Reinekea sp. MED297] [Reinekea blandensis MED297]